jgi:hypothetical protein
MTIPGIVYDGMEKVAKPSLELQTSIGRFDSDRRLLNGESYQRGTED